MAGEKAGSRGKRFKLVCFDLDGTIIDETIFIWQTIHDHLDTDKEERKKAAEDFYSKRITYEQWMMHDIRIWKDAGANKSIISDAIRPLRLMEGALEAIKELKARGYKLAIISGSLNIALEHVLPDYKDYFDDVFINKIYFDGKGNISGSEATPYDEEHKATGLKELCRKEGISTKEVVFIGDHKNDIHIAKEAGFSIAFNCKSDSLAQIADVVVEKKDLREILKHVP